MTIHILHDLDKHGGFTVVDLRTGISSYAYPTSTHATQARKRPSHVAAEMLKGESRYIHTMPEILQRDREREDRLRARNGLPPRPERT